MVVEPEFMCTFKKLAKYEVEANAFNNSIMGSNTSLDEHIYRLYAKFSFFSFPSSCCA